MRWIKLHMQFEGREVWVNMEKIDYILRIHRSGKTGSALCPLIEADVSLDVTESIEEIMSLLEAK